MRLRWCAASDGCKERDDWRTMRPHRDYDSRGDLSRKALPIQENPNDPLDSAASQSNESDWRSPATTEIAHMFPYRTGTTQDPSECSLERRLIRTRATFRCHAAILGASST